MSDMKKDELAEDQALMGEEMLDDDPLLAEVEVLKAERDCVVDKLLANPGESLSVDQQIIAFK